MANYKRYQSTNTTTDSIKGWFITFTGIFLLILIAYKVKVYMIITAGSFSNPWIHQSVSVMYALGLEGIKLLCLVMAINDAQKGNVWNVRIGYGITVGVMLIDMAEAIHFNGSLGPWENNAIFFISALIVTVMEIRISRYYMPDKAVTISVTKQNEMLREIADKSMKIKRLENELTVINMASKKLNDRCVTAESELQALREKSKKTHNNAKNRNASKSVTPEALRQRRYRLNRKKDKKEAALQTALKDERYEDVTKLQNEIDKIERQIEEI